MAGRSASFLTARARLAPALLLFGLAASGCSPDLSPNTYNSGAVQQANKAEQGVVVGVRRVDVRVSGATGAVVGGAAGGIAGAQLGSGSTSAFGALGGSLIGGLVGAGVEHAAGDTKAYEYIVRKTNKELVSVTQKGDPPLAIGERVLVIAGSQARIVPDYTVSLPPETPEAAKESVREPGHEAGPVSPATAGQPAPAPPQAQPPQAQGQPPQATAADAPPPAAAAQPALPPASPAPNGPAAAAQPAAPLPVTLPALQAVTPPAPLAASTPAAPADAPVILMPTRLTPPAALSADKPVVTLPAQ
jgi:outer membrane lipoprotein SlyB